MSGRCGDDTTHLGRPGVAEVEESFRLTDPASTDMAWAVWETVPSDLTVAD